jgi:Sad1 / UNC-like C-terminal
VIPPTDRELNLIAYLNFFIEWASHIWHVFVSLVSFSPSTKQHEPIIRKNYAESTSGASILYATSSILNKKAILENSKETYMQLHECAQDSHHFLPQDELPYLIINLSDDIVVESVEVSNHEDFSNSLHQIYVEGSIDYPPSKWFSLGTVQSPQTSLSVKSEKMIRYLKLSLRGPPLTEANHLYCTLTSVKVFGYSMNFVMRKSLTELNQEPLSQLTSSTNTCLPMIYHNLGLITDASTSEFEDGESEDEDMHILLKKMVTKLSKNQ